MSANRQNTARPPVLPPAGPLVCVVTAIREVSPKIAGTWQALRGQTLPWFEWVVMAPGPLWEPVSELCEGDERLRFLQPLVGESSLAEWAAGEETGAPVVVLLDESGHIEPQYLEYVTLALLLEREFSLCCTGTAGQAPPESGTTKWEKSVFAGITAIALRREWLAAEDVPRGRLLYLPLFLCTCAKKPQTLFWQGWFEREAPDLEIVRFPEDAQLDSYAQPEYVPWERQSRPKHSAPHFLLVVPWMEMGGADRFNLDLLRGLSQRGYRISLLTTQKAENAWLDHVLQLTPNVFCLADFLSPDRFAAFFSYFIQSRGVDVMMVSNSPEGYCLLPWLEQHFPRLPVVDYVHMPEPAWRSGGHARQSGMLSGFLRKTYTCNEHSRRQLIEQYHHREDKVKTVYIGVDAARFDPCKTQVGQVYETLGIEKSRPVVLFPCRLSAQKRPFFMLEMATRLAKSPLRPAFVVVGEGPLLKELERAVRERNAQDTVFFAGKQEDIRPWYRDAALTLVCSLYEGLSLTAYESMAMGTPVITADVGGQAELVDRNTGVVIPMRDDEVADYDARNFKNEEMEDYTGAIEALLGDPPRLEEMGRAARCRVLSGFTVDVMADTFAEELAALYKNPVECDGQDKSLLYAEFATLAAENTKLLEQRRQLHRWSDDYSKWADAQYKQVQALEPLAGELQRVKALRGYWLLIQVNRFLDKHRRKKD